MLNSQTDSKEQDLIQIVFTIDENYIQHCAVTITSLCENTKNAKINISIVNNGIGKKSVSKLNKYLKKFTNINQLNWLEIDTEQIKDAPLTHHVSLATYYRILLPKILDKNLTKVLFLDSDIIIRKNITPLWETDISEFSHGAVAHIGDFESHKEYLGMDKNSDYFNAGIMLINLKYWREYEITEKAIQYLKENVDKIKFWDQDILNCLFESKWFPLDSQWNATEIIFKPDLWKESNFEPKFCQELNKLSQDPAIVHFTGSGKPWHYYHNHPYKQEYYYYLKKTPWKRFRPIDKPSIFQRIKKNIRKILSYGKKIVSG